MNVPPQSVVAPIVARRHFVRWIQTHGNMMASSISTRSIFDTLYIHKQSYTLCFLSHQLWDRLTEDVPYNGKISVCLFSRYFKVSLRASKHIFACTGTDEFSEDVLSDFILRVPQDVLLVELFSILYASTPRRERIRMRRRSSETQDTPPLRRHDIRHPPPPTIVPVPIIPPPVSSVSVRASPPRTYWHDARRMLTCCCTRSNKTTE